LGEARRTRRLLGFFAKAKKAKPEVFTELAKGRPPGANYFW